MNFFQKLFRKQTSEEEKAIKFRELDQQYGGGDKNDKEYLTYMKASWLTSRGNLLGTIHRYNEAITDFEEAIALKQDMIPAWFSLAIAYKETGDAKKGLDIIKKAPDKMKLNGEILANKEDMMKDI